MPASSRDWRKTICHAIGQFVGTSAQGGSKPSTSRRRPGAGSPRRTVTAVRSRLGRNNFSALDQPQTGRLRSLAAEGYVNNDTLAICQAREPRPLQHEACTKMSLPP